MYLVRNPGLTEQVVVENDWRAAAGIAVGTAFNVLPNIELCNGQLDFFPGLRRRKTGKRRTDVLLESLATTGKRYVTGRLSFSLEEMEKHMQLKVM
ncbi:hypothetical protein ACFX4S_23305 [Kosakonia sp. YIM B13605]|uniref:hypothetical protein n=1 Tax=Kosakonia TaxID=1330547 RepID=UPI0028AF8649|nr:hypothetical protein [Kosakonia sacchari]